MEFVRFLYIKDTKLSKSLRGVKAKAQVFVSQTITLRVLLIWGVKRKQREKNNQIFILAIQLGFSLLVRNTLDKSQNRSKVIFSKFPKKHISNFLNFELRIEVSQKFFSYKTRKKKKKKHHCKQQPKFTDKSPFLCLTCKLEGRRGLTQNKNVVFEDFIL